MAGIYCNNCGAELDEAPTLLPEKRSPCPTCGSLARRFDETVSDPITIRPASIESAQAIGTPTLVQAETAEGTGTAYNAMVRVTDHLVVAGGSFAGASSPGSQAWCG